MTVNLSALAGAGQQFFDNNGVPLSGGKLYSYAAGTTTPQATYTSVSGGTTHTNPIILDSAGRVSTGEIWVTAGSNYKFVLKDSGDVLLATWDNITGINGTGIATDANLVSYTAPYTGAVAYTVEDKLAQTVSVKDFGAVGDGVTDDTAAIQAALDSGATEITVPDGTYIFTSLSVPSGTAFVGTGGTLKLKDNTCVNSGTSYYLIHNLTGTDVTYRNLIIDGNKANNTQFLVADAITATGSYTVVSGCRIDNAPDSGIMFSNCPNGICENNIIAGGTDLGIYVNGTEGGADRFSMLVTGNTITGFPFGGIGIKRSVENTIVSNNIITSCGNGITVEDFGTGSGGHPNHLLITGNLMKNIGFPYRSDSPAETGISLSSCTNVSVLDNKIQNVSGYGIAMSGVTDSMIKNNHLVGYPTSPAVSGNTGIYCDVDAVPTTPTRNTISGNIVVNFDDYAAYLLSITYSIVNENILQSNDTALRVNAPCDNNTISYNRLNGTLADAAILSGATANISEYNYAQNAATEWQKAGHIRSTAVATPVGNITPSYPGQLCWITTAGPKIFLAYGIADTEWIQIG